MAVRRTKKDIGGRSVISGWAPESAGKTARLVDAVGNEHKQKVNLEDSFYFDELDSGVYTLTVEGGYEQHQLEVDGRSGLHVEFQPLVSTWEAKSSPAGSMPGYSVVRVEVEGMRGLPVYIWKDDWEGMMRRTGSKPEYGECAVEFSPLGPGTYMVEPEGLGIWADVELTGLEAVWLDFRRKAVPSSPNIVTELPGGFVDEAEDETDDCTRRLRAHRQGADCAGARRRLHRQRTSPTTLSPESSSRNYTNWKRRRPAQMNSSRRRLSQTTLSGKRLNRKSTSRKLDRV